MKLTQAAREYKPTGDPDHVAYGANYTWECSCGRSGRFLTVESKAKNQAHQHEQNCWENGETTVDVV